MARRHLRGSRRAQCSTSTPPQEHRALDGTLELDFTRSLSSHSTTLIVSLVGAPPAPFLRLGPPRSLSLGWGTAARLAAFRHHGRRLVVERLPSPAPPKDRLASWSTAARPRLLLSSRLAPRRRAPPLVPPADRVGPLRLVEGVANAHLVLVVADWVASWAAARGSVCVAPSTPK